jgi:hypothetical protein
MSSEHLTADDKEYKDNLVEKAKPPNPRVVSKLRTTSTKQLKKKYLIF